MTTPSPMNENTNEPTGKVIGWWAEYKCGCVSKVEKRKRDVLDYCGKHGDDRRYLHPEFARARQPKEETK